MFTDKTEWGHQQNDKVKWTNDVHPSWTRLTHQVNVLAGLDSASRCRLIACIFGVDWVVLEQQKIAPLHIISYPVNFSPGPRRKSKGVALAKH